MSTWFKHKQIVGISVVVFIVIVIFVIISSEDINTKNIQQQNELCKGNAACFEGTVTQITDGDTIRVDDRPIRLALTSTPELDENYGKIAKDFTARLCPLGANVIVDEDDGQREGSYGRMIGLVYCNGILLNSALLENELAYIDQRFCSDSEFGNDEWAVKYGC